MTDPDRITATAVADIGSTSADALANHSIAIVNRVTAEVMDQLDTLQRQLDTLRAAVIKDAGETHHAIKSHIELAAAAMSVGEVLMRQVEELADKLVRPRT